MPTEQAGRGWVRGAVFFGLTARILLPLLKLTKKKNDYSLTLLKIHPANMYWVIPHHQRRVYIKDLDFTISVYGSSCNSPFLYIGIPSGRMGCQEIDRERKEERMILKKREFHELPVTEIVKSGTITVYRLVSYHPIAPLTPLKCDTQSLCWCGANLCHTLSALYSSQLPASVPSRPFFAPAPMSPWH